MKYRINAYSKINLHLDVLGKRDDGYHNIETVFQSIALKDVITLEESDQFAISVSDSNIPLNESNTVTKAYSLFREHFSGKWQEFSIDVQKTIPSGSGMGGGSADGACLLRFLNSYYDYPFNDTRLMSIAEAVGMDVVFLMFGGTAIGEELGQKLTFADNKLPPDLTVIIVFPNIHVSTDWAYSNIKKYLTNKSNSFNIKNSIENKGISMRSLKGFRNIFEPLVFEYYPRIGRIKDKMAEFSPVKTMMTGTGSAVFGIFADKPDINALKRHFSGNVIFETELLTDEQIKQTFLTTM
ncbi:MAG: 4-(cytidine 5'-diphospho)-2-C-methyl-D-erythritol kinase [bacterium]